ncbi:peptidase inhibitor family I36 protein [Streptomyces sparsogenes]|uniref:peptidase inhibitor family I36 protein n=1 Tax=Streptomyces sparsogenes TaxID=67365 RepID=UPI0033CAB855
MKRAIALTVSALSLSAAGLIGLSGTAHAQGPCGIDDLCLFQYANMNGIEWGQIDIDMCVNIGSEFNNKASSMENRGPSRMWLYDKKNCAGRAGYSAAPNSKDKTLVNNGFDNKASSVK